LRQLKKRFKSLFVFSITGFKLEAVGHNNNNNNNNNNTASDRAAKTGFSRRLLAPAGSSERQ
jgi:hypothetical protein